MNDLSYASELFLLELRDAADQDYVLARVAYRAQLDMQFIWLAQHAIEKYLKILLVFNGRSAQGVGHNLGEALRRLGKITDVPFLFPPFVANFGQYLDDRFDRYAERSYAVSLKRLVDLDATVWHLRRYCVNLRGNSDPLLQITREQKKRNIAALADSRYDARPHSFTLSGGYLEKLRSDPTAPLRNSLIWNNLYFSRRRRTSMNGRPNRAVNSWLVLHPGIFRELESKLDFSKQTRDRFKTLRPP